MTGDDQVVLIVDDNRELADLYAQWLADHYQVRTAYNGQSALEQLDETVDVVLLDRRMPGLSGDEVLARSRNQGYDCLVVVVTAVEPGFDILDLPFDGIVRKPVSSEDLHTIIERLLPTTDNPSERAYAALVSKKATLEAESMLTHLQSNRDYVELLADLEQREREVDADLAERVQITFAEVA